MNIEDYREYCLSLDNDVEEKLPFQKFKSGEGVLVFYVSGHHPALDRHQPQYGSRRAAKGTDPKLLRDSESEV